MLPIRAITLDLDDTLWPIEPVIRRAETLLHDWLVREAPEIGRTLTPEQLRAVRDELWVQHPERHHDLAWFRLRALEVVFERAGLDPARAAEGYEIFLEGRQTVIPYPDAIPALSRLMARYPLAAVSNGNADVQRVGLAPYLRFALSAKDLGMSKPDPRIFHTACRMLDLKPSEVLHIGDDPHLDVVGARRAGLHAAWINRKGHAWTFDADFDPGGEPTGHHEFADMKALADWLLAR